MAAPNAFTGARPKRAGDDFVRANFHQDQDEPSSKKPRFDPRFPSTLAPDAPDEDPVLEIDEIGKGGRIKRNAVNIDGYDSDSSTENFQVRADAKAADAAPQTTQDIDEDEDMFADDDNEAKDNKEASPGRKKKDVRFLDVHEIEGQEETSKSGGHVAAGFADSSSDSGDDEERDRLDSDLDEEVGAGGKKRHAPKLDAFNMKAEAEEGRFDEHGNYVRKAADPYAVHDSWLEGLSKKDIKRAREAQAKRDEERRQRDLADDAISTSDVLSTLISHMEKSETVLESLQRLGKSKLKKSTPKVQKAKFKGGGGAKTQPAEPLDPAEAAAEARRKESIEAITGAADQLMTRGQSDIYDAERELLMRQFKKETGEDWKDPAPATPADVESCAGQQWHYRWVDGRDGGEDYGPYDGPTMTSWTSQGYFSGNVEFRRVGDREWSRVADFS
jgi:CD2 antigen cytoplasmic tail-binding protein 2